MDGDTPIQRKLHKVVNRLEKRVLLTKTEFNSSHVVAAMMM